MALLKHSSKIDKTITEVVENDLKTKVISINRMEAGEVSFVYKIKIKDGGILITKVFRSHEFIPSKDKLEWIEGQLEKHRIPFAKTYKLDSSSNIFPNGYMIQEFIEGKSGFDLIINEEMSFGEYFNKLVIFTKSSQNSKRGICSD